MLCLQIPSPRLSMLPSVRDVALPLDEASSIIKAFQMQLYLFLIPAVIIVYDTRTSLLQIILSSSLTSYQYVRWTKRYAIKCPRYHFMTITPDWQIKYFWVSRSVAFRSKWKVLTRSPLQDGGKFNMTKLMFFAVRKPRPTPLPILKQRRIVMRECSAQSSQ